MIFMSFICDYAKISPLVLMYRVEHSGLCFATYRDIDEDKFVLSIFPWDELSVLSGDDVKAINEIVNPYIFDPED